MIGTVTDCYRMTTTFAGKKWPYPQRSLATAPVSQSTGGQVMSMGQRPDRHSQSNEGDERRRNDALESLQFWMTAEKRSADGG